MHFEQLNKSICNMDEHKLQFGQIYFDGERIWGGCDVRMKEAASSEMGARNFEQSTNTFLNLEKYILLCA